MNILQVLNRSLDTKSFESKLVMPQIQPPVPLVPQFVITSGVRKDCIRLRGLPYEASVENILEFLGDFSKNIVYQGVHMVYNSQVNNFIFIFGTSFLSLYLNFFCCFFYISYQIYIFNYSRDVYYYFFFLATEILF